MVWTLSEAPLHRCTFQCIPLISESWTNLLNIVLDRMGDGRGRLLAATPHKQTLHCREESCAFTHSSLNTVTLWTRGSSFLRIVIIAFTDSSSYTVQFPSCVCVRVRTHAHTRARAERPLQSLSIDAWVTSCLTLHASSAPLRRSNKVNRRHTLAVLKWATEKTPASRWHGSCDGTMIRAS